MTGAVLSDDGVALRLQTTPLAEHTSYTLSFRDIPDRARAGNVARGQVRFVHLRRVKGLRYTYYAKRPAGDDLSCFEKLAPTTVGVAEKVDLRVKERDTELALRFDGMIEVPVAGEYTFYTCSDDGSRISVDGEPVVTNDGMHGAQ